jgi:hypothetical protein
MPVTACADAFGLREARRTAYVEWLEENWRGAATALDFAVETGLIAAGEVQDALERLENEANAESLFAMTEKAQDALGAHLSKRAEQAGCNPDDAAFFLSGEQVDGTPGITIQGQAMVLSAVPRHTLHPDVSRLCLSACGVIDRSLGVATRMMWEIDDGYGYDYALSEKMQVFRDMPIESRSNAKSFLDACQLESVETGVFSEVVTLADAREELEWLACAVQTQQELRSLDAQDTIASAQDLGEAARALSAALAPQRTDQAWLDWVSRVAMVCAQRTEGALYEAMSVDECWPVSALIQVNPQAPWWSDSVDALWENTLMSGEPFLSHFAWHPGRSGAILDALECIVDAAALVWSMPDRWDTAVDSRNEGEGDDGAL